MNCDLQLKTQSPQSKKKIVGTDWAAPTRRGSTALDRFTQYDCRWFFGALGGSLSSRIKGSSLSQMANLSSILPAIG